MPLKSFLPFSYCPASPAHSFLTPVYKANIPTQGECGSVLGLTGEPAQSGRQCCLMGLGGR